MNHYLDAADISKYDWPDKSYNKNGDICRPLGTIENCEYMLNHYSIGVKYNQITKAIEVDVLGVTVDPDNRDNVLASIIVSLSNRCGFPVTHVKEFTKVIATRRTYNPVREWIDSYTWDGVDRITSMVRTVNATKPIIANLLMRKWFTMCIESLYMENFATHGCLVFKGLQGAGKTTWSENLLPRDLSNQYIRTGLAIDPTNKDSYLNAICAWIAELGELGATLKRDVDRLKSFITLKTDRIRRPYDAMESTYKRRTCWFASVDRDNFLTDEANRRWWVIEATSIDYLHKIDMGQFWAQVKCGWVAGDTGWMDSEVMKILNESNEDYRSIDPVAELLSCNLQWSSSQEYWHSRTATQVAIDIGIKDPKQSECNKVAAHLKARGIAQRKTRDGRFYMVPKKNGEMLTVEVSDDSMLFDDMDL